MQGKIYAELTDRALIAVEGEDRVSFLQGLVSNDVAKVDAANTIHAAFLTPQGKYLHDFFILPWGDGLLLDTGAERVADLMKRLKMYKLRAKVTLTDVSESHAVALLTPDAVDAFGVGDAPGGSVTAAGAVMFRDPRLAELGGRIVAPKAELSDLLAAQGIETGAVSSFDDHRLRLGVPDGPRDLVVEKSILLESGFDELNGVDWNKGCYMGQELTARTKYRGLVKKRLMPVAIDGELPESGAAIELDGKDVGEIRSVSNGCGLALLRLEAFKAAEEGATLHSGAATVTPSKPDWAEF